MRSQRLRSQRLRSQRLRKLHKTSRRLRGGSNSMYQKAQQANGKATAATAAEKAAAEQQAIGLRRLEARNRYQSTSSTGSWVNGQWVPRRG